MLLALHQVVFGHQGQANYNYCNVTEWCHENSTLGRVYIKDG